MASHEVEPLNEVGPKIRVEAENAEAARERARPVMQRLGIPVSDPLVVGECDGRSANSRSRRAKEVKQWPVRIATK